MPKSEYDVLADKLTEMTRALIRHPDFYKVQAQATKMRFDALVAAGFDKQEALAVTAMLGSGADLKPSA